MKHYAVVFDLDETLGHFQQLSIFWSILKNYYKSKNMACSEKEFFDTLDLFNLFLRPNILKILHFLKDKKKKKICDKVMIFTNNQGPNSWADLIKEYFHYKLDYELFDQIIRAFTVRGKVIEICRKSMSKSYSDFINCTELPDDTQVLFLDDQHHPDMEHKNVVYLYLKPYEYNYKYDDMINMYYNKLIDKSTIHKSDFFKYFKHSLQGLQHSIKSDIEHEVDKILWKKIIKHIDKFLKTNKNIKYSRKKRSKKHGTQKK